MKSEKKRKKNHNTFTTGFINITSRGNAFFNAEGFQKDIFIPKNKTNRALEGDLVKISLKKRNRKGMKIEVEVLKVIKRKTKQIIGILNLQSNSKYGSVIVYNSIHIDIFIPIDDEKLKKISSQ